jgi:hypothetical protein
MKGNIVKAAFISFIVIITLLISSEEAANPGKTLLIVSSEVEDSAALVDAVKDDLEVILYDSGTGLDTLLQRVRAKGHGFNRIGLAVHDYGEAKFYLTGKDHVSLTALAHQRELQKFWMELGDLVDLNGSIDIFACNLSASPGGKDLIELLQQYSGVKVNASSNETGNNEFGGDWVLESGNVNLKDIYFSSPKLEAYSGLLISKIKKIIPVDSVQELSFGRSVAISGDIAVVGRHYAPQDDNGAIYIYRKDKYGTKSWGLTRILRIRPSYDFKDFGKVIALDGDTLATSAITKLEVDQTIREIFIFQQDPDDPDKWKFVKRLESPDEMYDEGFGADSIALYDDYLAVSDILDDDTADNSGAVYLFERDKGGADNWGLLKKIKDDFPVENDNWGKVLDLEDDMLVIRNLEPKEGGGTGPGSVELLYKDQLGANNWGRLKRLFLENGVDNDRYGWDASVSGDFLAVSAVHRDEKGIDSGAVYLYQKHRGGTYNWGFLKKLLPADLATKDYFGGNLSLKDGVLVVGAHGDDNAKGENAGVVFIFHQNKGGDNVWGLSGRYTPDDGFENQKFGSYVANEGSNALIGVPDDTPSGELSGSAYLIDVAQSGVLKGVVRPSRPRKAGGKWSIEGRDEWYSHRQKISLPPGEYTLIAKPVEGYKVKFTSTVTVVANKSVRGRVVYEPDNQTQSEILNTAIQYFELVR